MNYSKWDFLAWNFQLMCTAMTVYSSLVMCYWTDINLRCLLDVAIAAHICWSDI